MQKTLMPKRSDMSKLNNVCTCFVLVMFWQISHWYGPMLGNISSSSSSSSSSSTWTMTS